MDTPNGNGTANSDPGPLLLTVRQLARLLVASTATVWRMRSSGKLPSPVVFGRNVRWRREDIERWLRDGCPEVAPTR